MAAPIKKAMLVYQAGIANVFAVDAFNLAPHGRNARRLYQGDFRGAEQLAQGLGLAGAVVRSAAANRAGDIANATWTDDLESQPFSDKHRPVKSNPPRNDEVLLEDMIDRLSLSHVLGELAGICTEKAEHIRANYGNGDAKHWDAAARVLSRAANQVNV